MAYTGNAPTARPWRGQVTGVVYWFGGDRRIGYVDARDGIKFLTPIGEPVFEVWNGEIRR